MTVPLSIIRTLYAVHGDATESIQGHHDKSTIQETEIKVEKPIQQIKVEPPEIEDLYTTPTDNPRLEFVSVEDRAINAYDRGGELKENITFLGQDYNHAHITIKAENTAEEENFLNRNGTVADHSYTKQTCRDEIESDDDYGTIKRFKSSIPNNIVPLVSGATHSKDNAVYKQPSISLKIPLVLPTKLNLPTNGSTVGNRKPSVSSKPLSNGRKVTKVKTVSVKRNSKATQVKQPIESVNDMVKKTHDPGACKHCPCFDKFIINHEKTMNQFMAKQQKMIDDLLKQQQIVFGKLEVIEEMNREHLRFSKRVFRFTALKTGIELNEFEEKLADNQFFHDVLRWLRTQITAESCEDRMLQAIDLLFDRYLIAQCSWTGVGKKGSKIPIRCYRRLIQLFTQIGTTRIATVSADGVKNLLVKKLKYSLRKSNTAMTQKSTCHIIKK
uniref:DUF4806 domain-containing protein n=1 Tax=Anopheles dirus TaxID=7168 RepID=A0A182NWR8_9DIPT